MAQIHSSNAKPPVIKPIRVLVNHPSSSAFLLSFSTALFSSVDSVVDISVWGKNAVVIMWSVVFFPVGKDDNDEGVLIDGWDVDVTP